MNATSAEKRLFVVAGMHRAGTSLITRSLMEFGVALGEDLLPAVPGENETGFWEDREIVEFNDRLLSEDGLHWASFQSPSFRTIRPERLRALKGDAAQLIRSKLSGHKLLGLKDPRICRMLHFWHPILSQAASRVEYLIAVRHPDSVAASLTTRDGFASSRGTWLWLSHMTDAISYLERVVDARVSVQIVDYDRFVFSPAQEMERLSKAYQLPWSPHTHIAQQFLAGFVQPRLRHHSHALGSAEDTSATSLQFSARALYLELLQMIFSSAAFPSRALSRQVAAFVELRRRVDPILRLTDGLERSKNLLDNRSTDSGLGHSTIAITQEVLQDEINGEDLDAWLRQALENTQSTSARVAMRLAQLEQQLAKARIARDRALRDAHQANQQNTDAHRALEELRSEHENLLARVAAEEVPDSAQNRQSYAGSSSTPPSDDHGQTHSSSLTLELRLKQEIVGCQRALHEANARCLELQSQCTVTSGERDAALALAARHHLARRSLAIKSRNELRRLRRAFQANQKLHTEAAARQTELEWRLRVEALEGRASLLALRMERLTNMSLRATNDALCEATLQQIRFVHPESVVEAAASQRNRDGDFARQALRLNSELERIRGSLSWRLTAPVRWVCAVILRGLGGGLSEKVAAIRRSGLFNEAWYLQQNPDVARSGTDPVRHYLRFGEREGRWPRPDFDPTVYLGTNPDVLAEGGGAFIHWVMEGRFEIRPGSPDCPVQHILSDDAASPPPHLPS